MTINNRSKGAKGEKIACDYLLKNGYKILETNYHYSKFAEIDIIASKNNVLIFVEVKARSTLNYGHPLEAISPNKLKRIYMAMLNYLEHSSQNYLNYQLDIVSIIGFDNSKIEHLENVGFE